MWHRDPLTRRILPGDTGFWDTVWQSPQFRAALADPNDPYAQVIAWAKTRPWWVVPLRQPCERYHFGAWFGQALGERTYAKPLIHDLYLFHEILHARTFVDRPERAESDWRRRMRADEIAVSLETEVLVYARHPDWRAHTFDQTIWADRFDLTPAPGHTDPVSLSSIAERRLFQARPRGGQWPIPFRPTVAFPSLVALWARRRAAAIAPLENDPVEATIARYEGEANIFFAAWQRRWRLVERDRVRFEAQCRAGLIATAMRHREARWEQVADAQGVPYGREAHASFEPL
jgi:hypothetical protein